MSRSVLLLRAVNVSGRNRVPMAELRSALNDAGVLDDVSTYIASGNIVCRHPSDPVAACARVRSLIHDEFGVDTPVILRTHDALARALASQPFVDPVENLLHAMFLEGAPQKGAVAALRERLVPGRRSPSSGTICGSPTPSPECMRRSSRKPFSIARSGSRARRGTCAP